jgi:nitrile hydratase beta subunit
MDSIHDLGGRQGFGPVEPEVDEPVFHDRWEAAVFTMTRTARAVGAVQNTDQFRHAIERIDPVGYLSHSYYGRWLGGLETLLIEAGGVSREALDARVGQLGGDPAMGHSARPDPAIRPVAASAQEGAARPLEQAPRFAVGQTVRTAATSSSGHTRLPGYVRNRIGTVVACHGGWVFPDTNAHGLGESPQHLYCVRFDGRALWGEEAEPGQSVSIDLFEAYLETADE